MFLYIISVNKRILAFDKTQRGILKDDYFSSYIILVIPYIPWVYYNILILSALRDQVITLLKKKIITGIYELSQLSYRSR